MKQTDSPIIVVHSYNTPRNILWDAITDRDKMVQWFFDNIPSFKPEVGFKTSFPVRNEDRVFTHLWEVTKVIPGQLITYSWKYEEYPGDSFVTFELMEDEDGIKLKLTMNIIEDFPQDIPEFKKESCIGGWDYFLGESLAKYVR